MGCSCGSTTQAEEETREERRWVELGGEDLEEPLRKEWVKLVRASWLVELCDSGGVLCRRQDLPPGAFIGLDELKAAGPFDNFLGWEWLRVIVVSYPWLQPGHPDPHAENLRVIAKALKVFDNDHENRGGPYGVLIDFAALHQAEKTAEEYELFKHALGALHLFYSHPNTVVFKLTKFPPGYPNNPSFQYVLPDGANAVEYMKRGWCATESAVSGFVKSSDKVLDLGQLERAGRNRLADLVLGCRAGRAVPLHPDDFLAALENKTFANKKEDFARVAGLYSAAFQRLLGNARELDYSGLGWGPKEVQQLLKALCGNTTLKDLNLGSNRMGPEGAIALAEVLRSNTTLERLRLQSNQMGPDGAIALAEALRTNLSLTTLDLRDNIIGNEGATALGEALHVNASLGRLYLHPNNIEEDVQGALRQADPRMNFTNFF